MKPGTGTDSRILGHSGKTSQGVDSVRHDGPPCRYHHEMFLAALLLYSGGEGLGAVDRHGVQYIPFHCVDGSDMAMEEWKEPYVEWPMGWGGALALPRPFRREY